MKTMEELEDELCEYCEIEEYKRGYRYTGSMLTFCENSGGCEKAYEKYKNTFQG